MNVYKLFANELLAFDVCALSETDARWIVYDAHSCRLTHSKPQQDVWLDDSITCSLLGVAVTGATRGLILGDTEMFLNG